MMGGASETYREKRIASRVLGGKPEGMRPLKRLGVGVGMILKQILKK